MKQDFKFLNQTYGLEMNTTAEPEGDFQKCSGIVSHGGAQHKGVFKLTKTAWETANKKVQERKKPLDQILVEGCVGVLKAELYIRPIPDGFNYVVDHRFFEGL